MSDAEAPPGRRAAAIFIFVTVMLDVLAMGMLIPVMPKLILQLVGDTVRGAEVYGVFFTAWALMQFLCSPLLGALSDRFGRRPIVLLSNLGLGLVYMLMAVAPSLEWLFVGRVLSGVVSASISTASAYIADVTPPEKRSGAFGLIGAAFGIGFVVGPAAGGVLGGIGPRVPFWVAGALSLVNASYGLFVLPESLSKAARSPFRWSRANPVGSLKLLSAHPALLGLAIVTFVASVAQYALPSTFVLYAHHRYGWEETAVGLTLAAVGVCAALVQGGLVKPIVRRLGEARALPLALGFGAVGFTIYGLAPTGRWFLAGVPVMALWGVAGAAGQGLMSRCVQPSEQGQLQGALGALQGIAGLIAPGIFTFTFARAIDGPSQLPGAPMLLAAALMVLAMLLATRATRALSV